LSLDQLPILATVWGDVPKYKKGAYKEYLTIHFPMLTKLPLLD
jgi:hypothetical protein